MNKENLIGITLFIAVGIAVVYLSQTYLAKNKPVMETESSSTKQTQSPSTTKSISAQEVAQHNLPSDCWMIIDAKVYDLSSFGQKHSGGEDSITSSCGSDATVVFDTKGDRGPHSAAAQETLENFKIGDLNHE